MYVNAERKILESILLQPAWMIWMKIVQLNQKELVKDRQLMRRERYNSNNAWEKLEINLSLTLTLDRFGIDLR